MRTYSLLFFLFLGMISLPLNAQKRDRVKMADEVYAKGEFFNAIEKYKKAYSKEKDRNRKAEILYKTGLCYFKANEMKRAEAYFERAMRRKYQEPVLMKYLGQTYLKLGNYEEAKDAFDQYLAQVPDDKMAIVGRTSIDSVLSWMDKPSRYQVENVKAFNTKFGEFSPFFGDDDYNTVFFTTSRDATEGKKVHGANGQSFADIFFSKLDRKGKWSTPAPIAKGVNTVYDEGTPYFFPETNTLFFTRCMYDANKELGCQIFQSKMEGSKWTEPVLVNLAHDSLVVAHPTFSEDGKTMIFVGNLSGSMGGHDLWITKGEGSEWSKPENLGTSINTPGNEMFPFLLNDSTLYFSSDGYIGFGGLDIFKATKMEDDKWVVENMRQPINSEGDDFGIVFQKKDVKGYFSSNREEEGRGSDDIYSFVLPVKKFSIKGMVISENDQKPIDEAEVKLIGSDGTNLEYVTEEDGSFKFLLSENEDYIVVALKKGYLNGKIRETTRAQEESKEFDVTLVLSPFERPIELPNILYDFNKWDLRPESMVSLDKLVETLNDNPNITIELMSHTDSRGGVGQANLILSQNRAMSVVNYLINNGIASDRLEAKGYGASQPKVADEKLAEKFEFIAVGDTLNDDFINALETEEIQETAHQVNRRTEFRVTSTDYVPKDENQNLENRMREGLMAPPEGVVEKGTEGQGGKGSNVKENKEDRQSLESLRKSREARKGVKKKKG